MAVAAVKIDARQRSIDLAETRGYWSVCPPGRSVELALDDAGQVITYTLRIPSASELDVWHVVTYSASHDDATCDCHAGQYGRPCWHRGAGVRSGRYLVRRARLGWSED